ncbi:MAG: ABC transporter permease subunit, partial [Candidatus Heimdallarchaeota archaeon]
QDIPSNADLYAIDKFETTLMATGSAGVVLLKTENSTWQDISLENTVNLKSISIVGTSNETTNNLIAYVVGENGNMWKTNNSGIEWYSIDLPTSVNLYSVDFINETVGITVGEASTIIGTTDGGITWEERDAPPEADGTFRAITYYRESRAYIVGDNGIFLKSTSTDNLGWVWKAVETSTTEQLNTIFAYSSSKIFLAGQNGDVLITKNAGSTFTKEVLPSNLNSTEIFGISMINGTHGWIVGKGGNTFSTDRDGLLPDIGARVGDYSDFAVYWDYAENFFYRGFVGMLEIYFFSMFLGFALGVIFAVAKIVDNRFANIIANIYIDFIRNTPLIVQLFAIHFGLPNMGIFLT